MTLLVVDIGNTLTKAGVWEEARVGLVVQRPTREAAALTEDVAKMSPVAPLAVCSAVPQALEVWEQWAARDHRAVLHVRGDTETPLTNRYRAPQALGADRLAAAVAAERRFGAPVIVASVGTALVVDVVSPAREYLGGAIWVGTRLGFRALADGTAGLPYVSFEHVSTPIGGDTETSLRAGASHGLAALIEGLAARMREYVGEEAPLAVTGGDAEAIALYLRAKHEVCPTLTLEGLALIWEHAHGQADADR